jgi:hypothetical protein
MVALRRFTIGGSIRLLRPESGVSFEIRIVAG